MNVDNNSGARQGSFSKLAPDDETDENEKTNPPAEDAVDKKDGKVLASKGIAASRTVKGSFAKMTPDDSENKTNRRAKDTVDEKDGKQPNRKGHAASQLGKETRLDDTFIVEKEWNPFPSRNFMKDDDNLFPDTLDAQYLCVEKENEYVGKDVCSTEEEAAWVPHFPAANVASQGIVVHSGDLANRASSPVLPGAVWEGGGGRQDDNDTISFSQDNPEDPVPPNEPEQVLVKANVVHDPVLVSASQVTCNCCPYGPLAILPVVLCCLGSGANIATSFLGGGALGVATGTIGGCSLIASTVLSCQVISSRGMMILSSIHMLLAVLSLFTILAFTERYNWYTDYTIVIALAIVAFFAYSGAAILTMYLNKRMQSNWWPSGVCCPYGPLAAVPSSLGCIGSVSAFTAVFAPFMFYFQYDNSQHDIYLFISVGENEDTLLKFAGIMGYISGSIGAICFCFSIRLSCATLRARALMILGSIYIALGIMSLLMLVAMTSQTCPPDGCELAIGGVFVIVAFIGYVGAGTLTFYLNRARLEQRVSDTAEM